MKTILFGLILLSTTAFAKTFCEDWTVYVRANNMYMMRGGMMMEFDDPENFQINEFQKQPEWLEKLQRKQFEKVSKDMQKIDSGLSNGIKHDGGNASVFYPGIYGGSIGAYFGPTYIPAALDEGLSNVTRMKVKSNEKDILKMQRELIKENAEQGAKITKLQKIVYDSELAVGDLVYKYESTTDPKVKAALAEEIKVATAKHHENQKKLLLANQEYMKKAAPFGSDSPQTKIWEKNNEILQDITADGLKRGCFADYQAYMYNLQGHYRMQIYKLKSALERCNTKSTQVSGVNDSPLKESTGVKGGFGKPALGQDGNNSSVVH